MITDLYRLVSLAEDPQWAEESKSMDHENWPEFMFHDPVANECWADLYGMFPEYQFVLIEKQTDKIVLLANSIPFFWDKALKDLPNSGWDWVLNQGIEDRSKGKTATFQSALQISIRESYRGKGLSSFAIQTMKEIGQKAGLTQFVAPVRPNKKALYPLASTEEYIKWNNENGQTFDPWLRVHIKLGGKVIKVCSESMTIQGTIKEWEQWAGMAFPGSGMFAVPGALVPVLIDRGHDVGIYVEPNVWVSHKMN
jgi:hypothetical protein